MAKLFLDDVRGPPDSDWVVVRSFVEFVDHIERHGVPEMMSFDHDLGDGVPTGMDCAKWLVEQDMVVRDFRVHSASPVGCGNVMALLYYWKCFKEESCLT